MQLHEEGERIQYGLRFFKLVHQRLAPYEVWQDITTPKSALSAVYNNRDRFVMSWLEAVDRGYQLPAEVVQDKRGALQQVRLQVVRELLEQRSWVGPVGAGWRGAEGLWESNEPRGGAMGPVPGLRGPTIVQLNCFICLSK